MTNEEKNKIFNMVAFFLIMENGEGIIDKSPDYILEKWNRYVGREDDSFMWGLHPTLVAVLEAYKMKWFKERDV